jgi:hypothetical protein
VGQSNPASGPAAGALRGQGPASQEARNMDSSMMLNARDFGAKGDGVADDTAAIQRALDAAAARKDTVFLPAGTYLCANLKMRPFTGLLGHSTYSYNTNGGAILKLSDANARCLVDMTGAFGAVLEGVCLDGNECMGKDVHGVLVDKPDYGKQEDTVRIERCRITHFSGSGVMLNRIWVFTVRHSMIAFNKGSGIRVRGWDGFVLDNWLSANGDCGYAAYDENAAITITANRIEWNAKAGIEIRDGYSYNITGNFIDRSGGPGVKIVPGAGWDSNNFRPGGGVTITGNMIYRSGAPNCGALDPADDCQIRLEQSQGVVCTGNSMVVGRNDGAKGEWSPQYGIVCHKLKDCVVKDNVMWEGALKALMDDRGEHSPSVVIRDNVGSLRVIPTTQPASAPASKQAAAAP